MERTLQVFTTEIFGQPNIEITEKTLETIAYELSNESFIHIGSRIYQTINISSIEDITNKEKNETK